MSLFLFNDFRQNLQTFTQSIQLHMPKKNHMGLDILGEFTFRSNINVNVSTFNVNVFGS